MNAGRRSGEEVRKNALAEGTAIRVRLRVLCELCEKCSSQVPEDAQSIAPIRYQITLQPNIRYVDRASKADA